MEKEDLEKFKKLALEEHQYYSKRYEQVSLIISGFGLYACLEYSKILITAKQLLSVSLFTAVIFFTASIIFSLCALLLEKQIRGHYLNIVFATGKEKENSNKQSLALENWNKRLNVVTIFTILLGIAFLIKAVYVFIY